MKNVENIYPLSPMQEAMLLHALSHRRADTLVNQFCYDVTGELDLEAFSTAWRLLAARHPILRTAFVVGQKSGPVQVVRKTVDFPVAVHDWREMDTTGLENHWAELKSSDRLLPFDPAVAPLTRINLVRVGDESYRLLWTSHHLILDRWCTDVVWAEWHELYRARRSGERAALAPAPRFSDYIAWLKAQPVDEAESYWAHELSGVAAPTLLCERIDSQEPGGIRSAELLIPHTVYAAAKGFAKRCAVTDGILLQAAVAIAAARISESADVTVGITVSGRPPHVAGIENMLGSFVGNVPVRVRLPAEMPVGQWLADLQQTQHRRAAYEYLAPSDIHRVSELDPAAPLFDTLLVPLARTGEPDGRELTFEPRAGELRTALPLTLGASDSALGLTLSAHLADGYRARHPLGEILGEIAGALRTLSESSPDTRLGDITDIAITSARPATAVHERFGTNAATKLATTAQNESGGREELSPEMVEILLRDEWARVLGSQAFGADESFFEIGGTSLQAARLHARIEALLRIRIPLLSLVQAPTLRAMTALLVRDEWPNIATPVIRVRDGAPAVSPLFLIASPEVNTVGYALLARHLDANRPVYVIQTPPDSGDIQRIAPTEVPRVASEYVDHLKSIQPHGPYYLVGMCTGAMITHEMARRLSNAGEPVAFAGIINTWANYTVGRAYHIARAIHRVRYYGKRVAELLREPASEQRATLRRVISRRFGPPSRRAPAQPANGNGQTATGDRDDIATGYYDPWVEESGWAHLEPGEREFDGTMTVFRIGRQQYWRTGERDLGWARRARAVRIVALPGNDHLAILREPQARDAAAALERELARTAAPRSNENRRRHGNSEDPAAKPA